jgi:lysine-N-methylase
MESKLNQPAFTSPQYAHSFRCIGSACEDTCCHGWKVPVDEAAYQRYQNLPPGPLSTLIQDSLERTPESEAAKKPSTFAIIRMNRENHCPMLSEDRLCRIQSEYGAALLSHTCATYPRVVHAGDGHSITALTLSCPEAARLVLLSPVLLSPVLLSPALLSPVLLNPDLLNPDLLGPGATPDHSAAPDAQQSGNAARSSSPLNPQLAPWTEPIRSTVLNTATNRLYPLWQRLFLLSIFSRRLDAIAAGELDRNPDRNPDSFLADFNRTAAQGSLRGAMDALPADDLAQMDAVLRLAGLMLRRSNVGPRFVECATAFASGIGNGPGATLVSLAARSRSAYERSFAPFFRRHPHMLENYLVNTILRLNFPFGSEKNAEDTGRSVSQRFAILAAQFALIRGLLIGVAGHHRGNFSADHVVHTVQAASKHFEHHPEFGKHILALLAELNLDGSHGLTILLREPASAGRLNPHAELPLNIAPHPQPRADAPHPVT